MKGKPKAERAPLMQQLSSLSESVRLALKAQKDSADAAAKAASARRSAAAKAAAAQGAAGAHATEGERAEHEAAAPAVATMGVATPLVDSSDKGAAAPPSVLGT